MNNQVDFFIAGMQKSGTTLLRDILSQHPDISSHDQMEMTCFYDTKEWSRGWKKLSQIYEVDRSSVFFLGKHATLMRSKEGLERLYEHNPEIKVLFILRDPVKRAYSSYLMECANGSDEYGRFDSYVHTLKENGGDIDVNDWHQNIYFGLGIYHQFLEHCFQVLPRENVLLINFESLIQDKPEGLHQVLSFLGISDFAFKETGKVNAAHTTRSQQVNRIFQVMSKESRAKTFIKTVFPRLKLYKIRSVVEKLNRQSHTPAKISPYSEKELQDFYKPHNKKLQRLYAFETRFWGG